MNRSQLFIKAADERQGHKLVFASRAVLGSVLGRESTSVFNEIRAEILV